jgi:oligopeptide/dipeptide ABC transporter ATP-binding protein
MSTPSSNEAPETETLLEVRDLSMDFPVRGRGVLARTRSHVHAVGGVDLSIKSGEVLGLVGESGCGKTTLGRCIVGEVRPTAGNVYYRDFDGTVVDLTTLSSKRLRDYQRHIRVVFQDPFSCLNPRMTVAQIVGDPLRAHGIAKGSELEDRVATALRLVGLSSAYMHRFPHAFSGGERQRINIARALILDPQLVIADEAVSALDVSIRAQILNLLRDLQHELQLTYLFISHDLSVIESICDRVAVMYLGKIVELAETDAIYRSPQHPYTEALLSAVPRPDPRLRGTGRRIRLADDFPDPSNPPPGCYFHTRCRYADQERCRAETPQLRVIGGQHQSACHLTEGLNLAGITAPTESAPVID